MIISNKPTYEIAIHCICGHTYSALGQRKMKCPKCGHVWDLTPGIPENQEKVVMVQKEKRNLLNGFDFNPLKG